MTLDCGFRLDLLVEDRLPVELKAVETILLARLRQSQWTYGFLLNFNAPTLQQGIRRLTR